MKKYVFLDLANTLYRGYSASDFYLFIADKLVDGEWIKDRHQKMYQNYAEKKTSYTQAAAIATTLSGEVYRGMTPDQVRKLEDKFMHTDRLFSHVTELINLFREKDFQIYIISADTTPSVESVARFLHIDDFVCSDLEIEDGVYTGKVLIDRNNYEKQKAVRQILQAEKVSVESFAIGDSTGDIDMLSLVDHPFVFQPHQEELIKLANENGWPIVDEATIVLKFKEMLASLD